MKISFLFLLIFSVWLLEQLKSYTVHLISPVSRVALGQFWAHNLTHISYLAIQLT